MKRVFPKLLLASGVIGVGFCTLTAPANAAAVQWSENNHYYEFVNNGVLFEDAKAAAESSVFKGLTGHLVTITSEGEQNFILDTFFSSTKSRYWLGLSDAEDEGIWRWISGPEVGQELGYSNWASGEPNDFSIGEDYAGANWNAAGQWNDWGGPAFPNTRIGYIVEYSQSEEIPTPALLPGLLGMGAAAFKKRRQQQDV